MRILYVFPHPDDESFGPAPVIAQQRRAGHQVYLLTLTRGGATKQRHKLGLDIAQMGELRLGEMNEMAKVLDLNGMTVLDLPDSGLKELDPREIESVVAHEISRLRPDVVVTYAVHGVSGFQDHLVAHAVVKRVFVELTSSGADYLKRLALLTVSESNPHVTLSPYGLKTSTAEEVDCVIQVDDYGRDALRRALLCYQTYQDTIEQSGVLKIVSESVAFELYAEEWNEPVLDDLFAGLE